MGVFVSFVRLHGRERAGLIEDVMRHEDGQDRLHAVVIEPLGRFVADDVRTPGACRSRSAAWLR